MDELRPRNNYYRRDRDYRDDFRYKHPRRDYHQRGRSYNNYNNWPPHRRYHNHYNRNERFDKDRNDRMHYHQVRPRPASSPPVPVEGSEEFLTRKIQNTSALIMRHLLTPDEALPNNKVAALNEVTEAPSTVELRNESVLKTKPARKRITYTAEEIRQKIIGHVTKLNEGRRRNFVNRKNSSELDNALNLINKRKRLEISEILRRMNSNGSGVDGNVPMVAADIGVELQNLPGDIIEELRKTLGIELEQLEQQDQSESNLSDPSKTRELPGTIPTTSDVPISERPILHQTFQQELPAIIVPPITNVPYMHHKPMSEQPPPVPEIKPELTFDEPQPHYDEPGTSNNKQTEKGAQLPEVKDESQESISDELTEQFHPTSVKDEPDCISSSDSGEPVISDLDKEPSPKFSAVIAIEATIKTFVEIDKKESDARYLSYNDLIDKIEGFERCSKLLEDYKNNLLGGLFSSVRTLDEDGQSYYGADCSQETPSCESVASETGVSARKHGYDEESGSEEGKRIKLEVEDDESRGYLNIEERVCALETMHVKSTGIDELYVGTESGRVLAFDLGAHRIAWTLEVCDGPVTSLALRRFKTLHVGTATKLLNCYDVKSGHLIASTPTPNPVLCLAAFSWDWVFVGCKNGTIVRYNPRTKRVEMEDTSESRLDILAIKTKREGPRKILIVGQRRGPVVIRDAESMLHLRNFYDHREVVLATVFAMEYSNGRLFCGTAHDDVLQFECHEAQLQHRLKASGSKGIACMRMVDGVLYAGCTNGSVYVYNTLDTPTLITVLEGPGGSVNCLVVLRKQIIISTLTRKLVRIDIPPEVLSAYSNTPK